MTNGEQPYFNITSNREVVEYVITGHRLERVEKCPIELYQLMLKCWDADPTLRPSFKEMLEFLVVEAQEVIVEALNDDDCYKVDIDDLTLHGFVE